MARLLPRTPFLHGTPPAPIRCRSTDRGWSIKMASKSKAVFGIYSSVDQAEHAVNVLIDEAFSSQDVSVLMPDQGSTREFAHHKDTKAPEGATAGATAGGVVGGTLGVLAGLGAL